MPRRILRAIGRLKPWKPTRSLPSYKEPTPETNRKLTREEEAELALTRTVFTPGTARLLVALFLVTIVSVPIIQFVAEVRAPRADGGMAMFDVFQALPSAEKVKAVRGLRDVWNLLPHAADLKKAEEALESDSVVSQWLLPPVQSLLVGKLRAANEQVYLGRNGWLFYRPDVDYVTGPAFLQQSRLQQRAHSAAIQPDPIKAIVQFRDQLASRGIELVLLPVPTKATIEGERLSSRVEPGTLLENASIAEFQRRLAAAGVRVFDPAPLLMQRKMAAQGAPQYLETDTHWRPEAMELVAQQLAASLNLPASEAPPLLTVVKADHR
jgi:alginate O-acetyltransferase complex protein AlgJ